jgi:hypothetical protein
MPVCNARTQNGDRAFLYMVIESIFISGFWKSDLYLSLRGYPRNLGYYRVTNFDSKSLGRSVSSARTHYRLDHVLIAWNEDYYPTGTRWCLDPNKSYTLSSWPGSTRGPSAHRLDPWGSTDPGRRPAASVDTRPRPGMDDERVLLVRYLNASKPKIRVRRRRSNFTLAPNGRLRPDRALRLGGHRRTADKS